MRTLEFANSNSQKGVNVEIICAIVNPELSIISNFNKDNRIERKRNTERGDTQEN